MHMQPGWLCAGELLEAQLAGWYEINMPLNQSLATCEEAGTLPGPPVATAHPLTTRPDASLPVAWASEHDV